MEIALLDCLNICTHLNDLSVNWLVVEVLNALVVNLRLACRCICSDNTTILKSIVICLRYTLVCIRSATECIC